MNKVKEIDGVLRIEDNIATVCCYCEEIKRKVGDILTADIMSEKGYMISHGIYDEPVKQVNAEIEAIFDN